MLEPVNKEHALNRSSLSRKIAEKVPNVSMSLVQKVLRAEESITRSEVANGGAVQLQNFGTFRKNLHKAYIAHKPQTNEPIHIPAKRVPYFVSSPKFKDVVNKH